MISPSRTPFARATTFCAVFLAAAFALPGCASDPSRGYAFADTYDPSVRTIAVPIFRNDTYASGLEVTLTEALITELRRTTNWRVVDPGRAATTLTGSVDRAELRELTTRREVGLVQEQALRVTVSFEWLDNRTGRTRVSRRNFTAISSFIPAVGVGEPLEVGQNAVVRELARDIVAELRADW